MNTDELYIFSHVHKCGGTTINGHVRKQFTAQEYINVHVDPDEKYYDLLTHEYKVLTSTDELEAYVQRLTDVDRQRIKIIFGHDVHADVSRLFKKKPFFFTFLRDPIDRVVSLYNYALYNIETRQDKPPWLNDFLTEQGAIKTFEEWTSDLPENYNPITDHFINSFLKKGVCNDQLTESHLLLTKDLLKSFQFVGITERPQDFEYIFGRLNVKYSLGKLNVTAKNYMQKDYNTNVETTLRRKMNLDIPLYDYALTLNNNKC